MILVINGTNRPGNKTKAVSSFCFDYLKTISSEEVKFLNLEDLDPDFYHNDMYDPAKQSSSLSSVQNEYIIPSNKWIIVSPEYNGSFPGILKFFIDAISIREYKANFEGKYVGLIGTSSGRAGNARGMDHLTTLLNYLKMTVYHNRLPVSQISSVLKDGNVNGETKNTLEVYLQDFIKK